MLAKDFIRNNNFLKKIISILRYGRSELQNMKFVILCAIPGELGFWLRAKFIASKFRNCGINPKINRGVIIKNNSSLSVGDNFFCNNCAYINASGGISIGDNVMIGPYVQIFSDNHLYDRIDIPIMNQGFKKQEVTIKDDVWIGASSIILPGVVIEKGVVVGAGSVVTKDINEYVIVAGNPARIIGKRGAVCVPTRTQ